MTASRPGWIAALALIALGLVAILFLQDPAMRLFSSERAAIYVVVAGLLLILAGLGLTVGGALARGRGR